MILYVKEKYKKYFFVTVSLQKSYF